jgi:hypothetical protein
MFSSAAKATEFASMGTVGLLNIKGRISFLANYVARQVLGLY